ncbi:MAG: hypothetical protein V7760_07215 [Marinobacter sp.]
MKKLIIATAITAFFSMTANATSGLADRIHRARIMQDSYDVLGYLPVRIGGVIADSGTCIKAFWLSLCSFCVKGAHPCPRHTAWAKMSADSVLADALTSVLAIIALLAGKYAGWNWVDPICTPRLSRSLPTIHSLPAITVTESKPATRRSSI